MTPVSFFISLLGGWVANIDISFLYLANCFFLTTRQLCLMKEIIKVNLS